MSTRHVRRFVAMVTIYRVIPERSLTITNLAHIEEAFISIYSGASRLHLIVTEKEELRQSSRMFGKTRLAVHYKS